MNEQHKRLSELVDNLASAVEDVTGTHEQASVWVLWGCRDALEGLFKIESRPDRADCESDEEHAALSNAWKLGYDLGEQHKEAS